MSRTFRNKRPKMKLGSLSHREKNGKVWDGTPQHVSKGCEHHSFCEWCRGNRTIGQQRHDVMLATESRYV